MKIKKLIIILVILIVVGFVIFNTYKYFNYGNDSYYDYYSAVKEDNSNRSNSNVKYETSINHNNKYSGVSINSKEDGIKLIEDDSSKQEEKCNNQLYDLENELKNNTNIYGINYCEIDYDTAKSISETIKSVFDKYPLIKNYITNVTIVNDGGTDSYIAAFKPAYTFATSNKSDGFPFVIKIQVFLNASYYLNVNYLDNVIDNAVNTSYFPKDTTKESLVAHELGHVITYVLDIKYSNSVNTLLLNKEDFKLYSSTLKDYTSSTFAGNIVKEAHKNYVNKYGNLDEETFRKNISLYANSKDTSENVIYNETVAEAFHDYYLHGESAKKESLEIMNIINSYL